MVRTKKNKSKLATMSVVPFIDKGNYIVADGKVIPHQNSLTLKTGTTARNQAVVNTTKQMYAKLEKEIRPKLQSGLSRTEQALAVSLSLPFEGHPIRLPGFEDSTCVNHVHVNEVVSLTVSKTVGSYPPITPDGQMLFGVTRDATRLYFREVYATVMNYQWFIADLAQATFSQGDVQLSTVWNIPINAGTQVEARCHVCHASDISNPATGIHGSKLYCVSSDMGSGMWFNRGDFVTVTVTTPSGLGPAANLTKLLLCPWNGTNWEEPELLGGASPQAMWVDAAALLGIGTNVSTTGVPTAGYYQLRYKGAAQSNAVLSVSVQQRNTLVSPNGTGLAWRCAPGLETRDSTVSKIRVNSVSMLLTNVSPVLNVNGSILAHKFVDGYDVCRLLGSTSFDAYSYIGSLNFGYSGAFETGAYTFLYPSVSGLDTSIVPFDLGRASMLACNTHPNFHNGLTMFSASSALVGINYPASIARIVVTANLEYSSNDQWYDMAASQLLRSQYELVVFHLNQMDHFYCNPKHWYETLAQILGVGRKAIKYAPGALAALMSVIPETTPLAAPAAVALKAMDAALRFRGI